MRDEPPAAFTRPPVQETAEAEFDPLQLCIYTTVALLAWILSPPLVVAVFGGMGVVAYVRARRRGLAKSRCKLGDTRLVVAYLALASLAGVAATVHTVTAWL